MKPEERNQRAKGKRQKAKIKKAVGCRLQDSELRTPNSELFIWTVAFALGVLLCVSTSAFAQQNGDAPKKNPYTGNAAAIAEGQALYKKMNCYGCHGMQGGGGMGPSLIDETWKTGDGSDLTLLAQIRDGKGQMPPYKTMVSDDEAWKLIAFVRSLYKGDPTKITW